MASDFVHTVYRRGMWLNEVEEEGGQLDGAFATRAEAVAYGRDEAIERKTEHVIHNEDGTIDEQNSYVGDQASGPG